MYGMGNENIFFFDFPNIWQFFHIDGFVIIFLSPEISTNNTAHHTKRAFEAHLIGLYAHLKTNSKLIYYYYHLISRPL